MSDKEGAVRRFLFLLLVGVLGLAQPPEGAFPSRITRWLDGDTAQIRVLGTPPHGIAPYETVRLLGVNAPEGGEPFADEATRYFRTFTMGKTVYVELSPWEFRDTHSRLLAYLWVETSEGWVMVNEEILRAGLARLLVYFPEREKYYCRFLRALTLAQVEKLSLWGEFPEPISLEAMEADPVRYVTEVATVAFEISRVGQEREGWALWAARSRFGFRAILQPDFCSGSWLSSFLEQDLEGRKVAVTGEIQWDSLTGGPRIVVRFPEQIAVLAEEKERK